MRRPHPQRTAVTHASGADEFSYRSLRLKVVAEGVETEEQSRLLRLVSCDEFQGFLFRKPVPSEIFEATFLKHDAK